MGIRAYKEEGRFAKARMTGPGHRVDVMVPSGEIGEQKPVGPQGEEFRSGPKTLQGKGVKVHETHRMKGPRC